MQFIDLAAQQSAIRDSIDAAIAAVLDHGRYIMGPEVAELEQKLGDFCGAQHVVTCASGTDALVMALMVKGVGRGDAVLVPTFTFAATAEAVALLGATPIFVDVEEDSFNIDPVKLSDAITGVPSHLTPVGVIAVDMFGRPAAYPKIAEVAERSGLWLISDAAQSFGATADGQAVGTMANLTTTSFFPAKPLGCYGDGGAVFASDPGDAEVLRSLRVHGSGREKYDNVRIGLNGRLDTIQAAILIQKLSVFADELTRRRAVAEVYNSELADLVAVPEQPAGIESAWAQYTIKVENRDALAAHLKGQGIPTAIYYPLPLHLQTAYVDYPRAADGLEVSTRLSKKVLSLPMHPYLDRSEQDRVISAIRSHTS